MLHVLVTLRQKASRNSSEWQWRKNEQTRWWTAI